MKTSNTILLAIFIAMLLGISLAMLHIKGKLSQEGLTGNREVAEVSREIGAFHSLTVKNNIKVYLHQGSGHSLRIVADSNLIPHIRTQLEGKELSIFSDALILKANRIDVYLDVKKIKAVKLRKSARLYTENELNVDGLQLTVDAGGFADMKLTANELECELSAGSRVRFRGKSNRLTVSASAGSIVDAYEFQTGTCVASATAGSRMRLNVTGELTAAASAGSNLKYRGNPKLQEINISSGSALERAD